VPLFGIFGFGIERFRATSAMTVSQYVEMRYSRRLRILTGFLNSGAGVLQMCVFPIIGAQFLRVLIQSPEYVDIAGWQVPADWIIMSLLLLCTVVFTSLGGFVTLIVTNFLQMIIIMVALYWLIVYLTGDIGLQHLWSTLESTHGKAAFNPFATEGNSYGPVWFAWLITMTILMQFSYGPYLQKYAAMDRPKTVSRSYLIGSLFANGRTYIILAIGVCAMVVMGSRPESQSDVPLEVWNKMVTAHYLSTVVPTVLMGVLLAGFIFADIATTDQYVLSWSTAIVNDCIQPFLKSPLNPNAHIRAVRLTILVLCVLFFIFGLFYSPTLPVWDYLWLCANIIGGTGVAVLFGMYWSRASTAGAYTAILICSILPVTDLVSRQVYAAMNPGEPFPIESQVTGLGTYALAVVGLVIVSLLFGGPTKYWDLGRDVKLQNNAAT
jgi:SSS family solute:Na+ symporter